MEKSGIFTRLTEFAKRPFREDMDVWNWILFLGFVIVVAVLWRKVLAHIIPNGE
jgi:hypothetical protein